MSSFWETLYNQFAAVVALPFRALFNVIMVLFVVKVVMGMEGAKSIDNQLPPLLWKIIRRHFSRVVEDGTPTYRQLLEAELTKPAKNIIRGISELDTHKFNKLPTRKNTTDVVIDHALPWNSQSWRAHLWIGLLARRFLNEGPWLIGFLQHLSLNDDSISHEAFLEFPLPKYFSSLAAMLFQKGVKLNVQRVHKNLLFVRDLFGREPRTGYLLPPWHLQGDLPNDTLRLLTWANGIVALTEFCQEAKSLQMAAMTLNDVITKGAGFVIYQCDLEVHNIERRINQGLVGMLPHSLVAGPGMVPLALEVGFGHKFGQDVDVDESQVAAQRDVLDAAPQAREPEAKRRKKSMFKCTAQHYRQAAGICFILAELLANHAIWKDIVAHYSIQNFADAPSLYHLMEYFLCELRRFIHQPVQRRKKERNSSAEAWLSKVAEWIKSC